MAHDTIWNIISTYLIDGETMHELMVTESILEITLRHAKKSSAGRVTDLYLVIGDLSSVIDDSVQFYWDFVSEGTIAQGAKLHFRRIPTEFLCQSCGTRFEMAENFICPACQSNQIKIVAGQEFYLEAIDIGDSVPSEELNFNSIEKS